MLNRLNPTGYAGINIGVPHSGKTPGSDRGIRAAYQEDFDQVLSLFADTVTEKGKADARLAGMVAMVNHRLPQPAIKDPLPLAPFSIGLMDAQPWYRMVKNTRSFDDQTEAPVSNPSVLSLGSFDYSLVLVYLVPLLVFAFTYSLYASEKESGTLPLLTIQQGNAFHVIRIRLLFRFLLLLGTMLVLNASDFLFFNISLSQYGEVMFWWSTLTVLYLLFWFAVSYLILSLKKSAVITALIQISVWLFFVAVFPGVVIAYAQAQQPVPLQDEISSYRREQSEQIWNLPPRVVADSFNIYNPRYASPADPAKDSLPLSDRCIAGYYDLLERQMLQVLGSYMEEIDKRNMLINKLLYFNPSVRTEQLLTRISGNDLDSYMDFFRQVDSYQKQWQGFLYPYHFRDEHLDSSDFYKFPVFHYQKSKMFLREARNVCFGLFLFSLLMTVSANFLSRSPDLSTR